MVNEDRADEMVAPDEEKHDPVGESTDGGDKTPTCTAAAQDDRLSPTSLYCSLPLNRDVQSIIDIFPKTDTERKKPRKLPCLYCERTFVADGLRQKHVERCHSMKQARRSSSRFLQTPGNGSGCAGPAIGGVVPAPLQCMYCNAFQSSDCDLSDLFNHLISEHADKYHACLVCKERFVLRTHLEEHRDEFHGYKKDRDFDVESVLNAHVIGRVKEFKDLKDSKNFKEADEISLGDSKDSRSSSAASKRIAIKSTKLGIKRSPRLQNKEAPNQNKSASNSSSQQKKKPSKAKPPEVEPPVERETVKVPVHENPYPTFDAYYRVKKITDHSIDNLRITSLTFNDVFDQAFYTRIKCNIADNLMNHIDGKLFKNEESESRISNFEKAQVEMPHQGENNYGCEISLNAATPVASFLAPQLGDDPETQIEYGSKASKKKTKPDEVHYKYFTRRKYQASIQEIKENRDLSKLDMWTQYGVKNRQQAVANKNKSEKEKQDYKKGEEYRAKLQNEELNRILDRRGPFEDLKLEANKQAVLDGNSSREARVEVSSLLEDILQKVFDVSMAQAEVQSKEIKTELTDAEIPAYLNLRRASPTDETYVDRSDKITLICESEETENFEVPQVSPRDKNSLVELSGEWTRSRLYICAACGVKIGNMRALLDHKNNFHQNVWSHHYEFVGKQGAYYKHLSIPGLGKMQHLEENPLPKAWVRSSARNCTKCKKVSNTLGELHRHILECGEDWSWMMSRKKCKYRPFGAKTRRKRRGLIKRQITNKDKPENKEKKTYKREGPRVKPSDAETIQRMLANLPAKRATRKEMSLKDGFPKLTSKKVDKKVSSKTRSEQHIQDNTNTVVKRKVLVANKCNPVGNVRKSVRNVNKVISSALIDNNIRMRRKFKNAVQMRRAASSKEHELVAVDAPVELTEEDVKKKISLFKKVQNLRRSVIKKRTTKVSTSSAETEIEPSTSSKQENSENSVRKTRSAAGVVVRPEKVQSPPKKKIRANLGTRLIRSLSLRRRNKDRLNQQTNEGESAASAPKRKLNFANIRKSVKKLKVSHKKEAECDIKVVQVEEPSQPVVNGAAADDDDDDLGPPLLEPMDGHFLEEGIRVNPIRTISEQSDNDNRSSAIAPSSDNTNINNDNSLTVTVTVHQKANRDKDNSFLSNDTKAPTAIVTPFNKHTEPIAKYSVDELLRTSSPCVPLNLVVNNKTECNTNASDYIDAIVPPANATDGDNPDKLVIDNTQSDLIEGSAVPKQHDIMQKPKNKLCKRAKGLNDCIAMLTSKLKCKSEPDPDPTQPLTIIPSFNTSTQQIQQHETAAVVVITPHDTTTEEQNVVIPEETDTVNLESAKEPEVAPPSPKNDNKLETMHTPVGDGQTATDITITDLSRPVIEQDKENIVMEQKSLLAQTKQGYDMSLEKVVDIFKCFDDIKSREIRNGCLDSIALLNHSQSEVINGLTKCSKPGRKIGAGRKTTNKRTENKVIQESLILERAEGERDYFYNSLERKIGSRRSLPKRKTKKANVNENTKQVNKEEAESKDTVDNKPKDEPITKKHETNTNYILQIPKFNLSTILEETTVLEQTTTVLEPTPDAGKCISDDSQPDTTDKPDAPEPPLVVQTVAEFRPPKEKHVTFDADIKLEKHLQPQDETDVLENKAIPHSGALSESEDELPLAALLKPTAPLSLASELNLSTETNHTLCDLTTPETVTVTQSIIKNDNDNYDIGTKDVPDYLESANNNYMEIANLQETDVTEFDLKKQTTSPKKTKCAAKSNKRSNQMEIQRLHAYFNPIAMSVDKMLEAKPEQPEGTIESVNVEKDTELLEISNVEQIEKVETIITTPELTKPKTPQRGRPRRDKTKISVDNQSPPLLVQENITSNEINLPILPIIENIPLVEISNPSESITDIKENNPIDATKLEEFKYAKQPCEYPTLFEQEKSEIIDSCLRNNSELEPNPNIILAAISQFIQTSKPKKSKKSRRSPKKRNSLENPDDVISLELTQKWNEQLRSLTVQKKVLLETKPITTESTPLENNIVSLDKPVEVVKSKRTSPKLQHLIDIFEPPTETDISNIKEVSLKDNIVNSQSESPIPKPTVDFDKCLSIEKSQLSTVDSSEKLIEEVGDLKENMNNHNIENSILEINSKSENLNDSSNVEEIESPKQEEVTESIEENASSKQAIENTSSDIPEEENKSDLASKQIDEVNVVPQVEFDEAETTTKLAEPTPNQVITDIEKCSNISNTVAPVIDLPKDNISENTEEDMPLKSLLKKVETPKATKSKKGRKRNNGVATESIDTKVEEVSETKPLLNTIDTNIIPNDTNSTPEKLDKVKPKTKRTKNIKSTVETNVVDIQSQEDHLKSLKTNADQVSETKCENVTIQNDSVTDPDEIISKSSESITEENVLVETPCDVVISPRKPRKCKENALKRLSEVLTCVNADDDSLDASNLISSETNIESETISTITDDSALNVETFQKLHESNTGNDTAELEKSSTIIETPPQPVKKKRGRKRKAVVNVNDTITQAQPETLDSVKGPTKTRILSPSPITVDNEMKKQLPLSIYDFDENDDDECTGDNSKENMKLKTKSPSRHKRNNPGKPSNDNKMSELLKEHLHEEINNTPLKDVQNESFIQTPDMNDSGLVNKLAGRFKLKKGKSRLKKPPSVTEELLSEFYCDICNKLFGRMDSLNKHKRTLTHIAKLSEIEALEAEEKKKQQQLEESQQSKTDSKEIIPEIELPKAIDEPSNIMDEVNEVKEAEEIKESITKESDNEPEQNDSVNLDFSDEDSVRSSASLFTPEKTQNSVTDVTKSVLVTSPFSIKTNNDSLKLADIISDVLNKPVENIESYESEITEPKRYKSLGERKSFDSDSVVYNPPSSFTNISPASTLINKNTSDEFLKNQLSLLENIIEENKASLEYMDEASVQSIDSIKSSRCLSDMSLVSDIQPDDSSRIISFTPHDEEKFIKPTQYEEISEDSMNNRNYELERSRKTLNRDEELFLECCSLLKSSSEVSNYSKKSSCVPPAAISEINLKKRPASDSWSRKENEHKNKKLTDSDDDDFLSDSCPNTPIGDTYDDFSNSDTIKTDWSTKINEKTGYEDISQSSSEKCNENTFKSNFNFKPLESKSEIDESSDSTDFRKNINAKFVGLMAEALKGKSPKRKKSRQRNSKKKSADFTQTSITDFAVQLTPKSSTDSDNYHDLTNDSKKMLTKGAMKVFEGLKVSIPTDDLDMNQVFNCSPKAKRLEIEESKKANGKSKTINVFGNKLGLKVTKKGTHKGKKKSCTDVMDKDKVPDVYDFEETQDNTDLFSTTSKMTFRNGKNNIENHEPSNKKAKIANDIVESESESNNQDLDLFTAEVQSVNSFSTETESSISIKPVNVTTTNENITKKKCVIMGRIFKNAFKAKVEGVKESAPIDEKESTPIDETDPLDRFIIGGPLEEVTTPPVEKSPISTERPKMTEKEMDLLFDTLLQNDQAKADSKNSLHSNNNTPMLSPIAKSEDIKDQKDMKNKKHSPKAVKSSRRRSRKHSESSDDEFNLSKSPKKRQPRKNNKPKDNGINLEQELKECMGVAGRKSQRKCTSGKQNVLIEYWSSDDSEFEAMLRLSMQETASPNKEKKKDLPLKEVEVEEQNKNEKIDSDELKCNKDKDHLETLSETKSNSLTSKTVNESNDDHDIDNTNNDYDIDSKPLIKPKVKRSSSNSKTHDGIKLENKPFKSQKTNKSVRSKSSHDELTLAANRRKRAAVDTLYYWSSSSDDDTENLIEVKSLRDEIDDEEDRPQHGWIVGDSPKKLVTLLAHAKGKKTNR